MMGRRGRNSIISFFRWGFRVGVLLVFIGVLSGCVTVSPSFIPASPLLTNQVVAQLQAKEERIKTLKGLFRISLSGGGIPMAQDLDGVLFYRRPDTVQLRGFTRMGGVVFNFVRIHEQYRLQIPPAGRLIQGRVVDLDGSDEGMSQLVLLSMRAMDAILGRIEGIQSKAVLLLTEGGQFRVDVHANSFTTRLWVDKHTMDVVRVEYVAEEGDPMVTVICENFKAIPSSPSGEGAGIRLPFHLKAEDQRQSGSMTLDFQELVANQSLVKKRGITAVRRLRVEEVVPQ